MSARIDRSWTASVEPNLTAIGEVDHLAILPLVERVSPMPQLQGEPGVSYLLRVGRTTLLFDTGLNRRGRDPFGSRPERRRPAHGPPAA